MTLINHKHHNQKQNKRLTLGRYSFPLSIGQEVTCHIHQDATWLPIVTLQLKKSNCDYAFIFQIIN